MALFTAWNTARMTTFHGGRLKTLTEELKSLKPAQPARKQTTSEIIAAMRAIRATLGG